MLFTPHSLFISAYLSIYSFRSPSNSNLSQSLCNVSRVLLTKTSSIARKAANNNIHVTRLFTNIPDGSFKDGKPTLQYAKKLPKTFASMTNEQVLQFAETEIPEACRECIVRDIMAVDHIEYDDAMKIFKKIAETNRRFMNISALPFYAGFGAAFTGGILSIPLVFEINCVTKFNDKFVTAEMPPLDELETYLEVGSASWGWMEPVLGQISFFLLCMQFSRAQLKNLGIRPYYNWQRNKRADYLVSQFPQYKAEVSLVLDCLSLLLFIQLH